MAYAYNGNFQKGRVSGIEIDGARCTEIYLGLKKKALDVDIKTLLLVSGFLAMHFSKSNYDNDFGLEVEDDGQGLGKRYRFKLYDGGEIVFYTGDKVNFSYKNVVEAADNADKVLSVEINIVQKESDRLSSITASGSVTYDKLEFVVKEDEKTDDGYLICCGENSELNTSKFKVSQKGKDKALDEMVPDDNWVGFISGMQHIYDVTYITFLLFYNNKIVLRDKHIRSLARPNEES